MSILEAVNSQKPLLLRDLELYKDILFEKYLNASTNNEFVKHLNDLKMNHEIYKQYSSYSLEISEYYSKEHIKEMWKDFYISIVKKEN